MAIPENIRTHLRHKWKILIWLVSLVLASFLLVLVAGCFFATHLMRTGKLGPKPTEFYQSLNILDHIVRTSQVLIVIVASVDLLFRKRIAEKLYLVNLIAFKIKQESVGNIP